MHDEDIDDEEFDRGPSRGEQRRQALAVLALAQQLVTLSEPALARIPMDDDLRELVLASRKITAQIARKRQIQYLAKHMRRREDEALDAIRAALEHDKADGRRAAQALHEVEYWRDRLVDEGDEALAELLAAFPQADRQHLRQLARNARQERLQNRPPHAYRDLFRDLRTLLSTSDDVEG
ncbi:ribosome biogenesis factor YjgA [Arenimonas composti]|nr:ribosome biogenesis factor YjgA [Arenimonas composti]